MTRRPFIVGALAALALAPAAGARAEGLHIYPVAGLYGLDQSDCGRPAGASAQYDTAKIAQVFCPQFGLDARVALGRAFAARMAGAFPGVVGELQARAADGETPEAGLARTLIASLHVSRTDLWLVEKPAAYDVYVPITLSLFLTNALTGEVMFVENYSTVVQGTLGKADYLRQAREQLPGQLQAAMEAMVDRAAGRFRPFAVSGVVRDKVGQRYVFDVGRKGGIREGDVIGADARVVFADANYSIIEPVLGALSTGQTLSRQVAQPVEMLEKPSALVVVAAAPDGVSRGYVNALFEDALGAKAGIAITPVNASFAQLRSLALGEARVGGGYADRRAIPDYFVRLSVFTLDPADLPTNQAYARRQVYEAHAFIEVLDHAGRVVFATRGADRIVDEVLHGVGFAPEQRRDTVIKNALLQAATALSRDFRPAKLRLPVQPAADGGIEIADAGGALGLGAAATLLRREGKVRGVDGDVWAPIGSAQVIEAQGPAARARYADPIPTPVRAGDQAAFDSAAAAVQSRRRFGPCLGADGTFVVDRRGPVDQPLYGPIAANSFAAAFAAPVYLPGFDAELRPLLGQFEDAESLGALHPRAPDICFEAVHQVAPQGEAAAADGFSSDVYAVALGYTLKRDGQKVGGGGLREVLTASAVSRSADPAARGASLQLDLAAEAVKLTTQVAGTLRPPL